MRNRGRDGRLVARMQRRRPLHSTREVAGDRSSPGRTRNTGVIGLRRHCHGPAARPDAPRKMPAVYENNISFCGVARARYDRYLFKRLSRYILYSIVKKCARVRVIVLHRKSRRRRRLVAICATSRCRNEFCESRWFFGFLQKNPEERLYKRERDYK